MFMLEEQSVTPEAVEPQSTNQEPAPEANKAENHEEQTDIVEDENSIPHSRVKEMTEKARAKGREEALRELLEEHKSVPKSDEIKKEKETKSEYDTPEAKAAIDIIEQAVSRQLEPLKRDAAKRDVETFLDSNPDALNYIDKIKRLRQENGNLNWDQAYKIAAYDDKMKQKLEKESQRAQESIQRKSSAQTEKPSGKIQEKKPDSLNERIMNRNVSLAEIERELLNN